jgi:hypothetical protein
MSDPMRGLFSSLNKHNIIVFLSFKAKDKIHFLVPSIRFCLLALGILLDKE